MEPGSPQRPDDHDQSTTRPLFGGDDDGGGGDENDQAHRRTQPDTGQPTEPLTPSNQWEATRPLPETNDQQHTNARTHSGLWTRLLGRDTDRGLYS